MSAFTVCANCGHQARDHIRHRDGEVWCVAWLNPSDFGDMRACRCGRFTDAVLPAERGRLTFGDHRQRAGDAETAPAWTPPREADRERAFRRWVKGGAH